MNIICKITTIDPGSFNPKMIAIFEKDNDTNFYYSRINFSTEFVQDMKAQGVDLIKSMGFKNEKEYVVDLLKYERHNVLTLNDVNFFLEQHKGMDKETKEFLNSYVKVQIRKRKIKNILEEYGIEE